jgi:hypothetical protein
MGGSLAAFGFIGVAVAGMAAADADDGRLAATANGQAICRIDGRRQAIVACDAARPEVVRDLVGPAEPGAAEFVAVGCLPGDVVATVCRVGDDWCLRTYRTEPGRAVDAAAPLQELLIGTASGPAATVDLAVSHARGWLAVTGLPPPLPPVLRAVVGGVRVGPLSDRSSPQLPAEWRPVAATVSPLDALVLLLRSDRAAANSQAADELAYYDTAGRQLLRLSAGVRGTAGLDFNRGDGTLWAAATDGAGRSGLWRLDAACEAGRQVVRPVLVAPFPRPRDIVCPSSRRVLITFGEPLEPVASIDPAALSSGAEP